MADVLRKQQFRALHGMSPPLESGATSGCCPPLFPDLRPLTSDLPPMKESQQLTPLDQAEAPFYVGCDVGGTNMKIGLVDSQGHAVAYHSIPTLQEQGPQEATRRMGDVVRQLAEEVGLAAGDIVRVGLATPGPMDIPQGMLICPGNLPAWHNSPIRQMMEEACGLPVTFANDANAAAYGEFWRGAGEKFDNMVLLTLGTGLGAGIIIGDRLVEGSHSCGGECGHIIIDCRDDAPLNSLGIRGTLEGYVGAGGVIARARQALAATRDESPLRELAETGSDFDLTPLAIAKAAEGGDKIATEVILETARYLAIGIVTIVHTVDPESVVLGGAMTFGGTGHPLGERFLAEVRSQAKSRMIASLRDQVMIDFALLGGSAGFIGAAGLARSEAMA
jgi:glucokinase